MSEELELTDERLAEALRDCTKREVIVCVECPFRSYAKGGKSCLNEIQLKAAERIGAMAEEIQRMRNATSRIVERDIAELVRLAGEANTAVERGLYGVSDELVSRMQEHMTELVELGRESMIHMQPLGQTGTRVDLVKVGGEVVYRREGFGDEEPGV